MIGGTKLPPTLGGLNAVAADVTNSVIENQGARKLPGSEAQIPSGTAARGVERLSGPDLATLRLALTNTASAVRKFAEEATLLTQDRADYDGPSHEYLTRRNAPTASNAAPQLTTLLEANAATAISARTRC